VHAHGWDRQPGHLTVDDVNHPVRDCAEPGFVPAVVFVLVDTTATVLRALKTCALAHATG
jgi:hypothetical protein